MACDAIVLLGCRVRPDGSLSAAAGRRAERAARAYAERVGPIVLASGGKRWNGVAEADAFAARLAELGVPSSAIVRERVSRSTRENARYVAALAGERSYRRLALVTCDWHMPRALHAFRRHGLDVVPLPAPAPPGPAWSAARRRAAEWLRGLADALASRLTSSGPRQTMGTL